LDAIAVEARRLDDAHAHDGDKKRGVIGDERAHCARREVADDLFDVFGRIIASVRSRGARWITELA
jgi:hypothetical protein